MIYKVCFNCPKCKKPCNDDKLEVFNELIEADSSADARKYFNANKPCRHMKITEIKAVD